MSESIKELMARDLVRQIDEITALNVNIARLEREVARQYGVIRQLHDALVIAEGQRDQSRAERELAIVKRQRDDEVRMREELSSELWDREQEVHALTQQPHDALVIAEGQRDQARAERDALRNEWSGLLIEQARLMALRDDAVAERDALRKDAARLDWLSDTVAIEAFGIDDVDAHAGCAGMNIYEHAAIVADERGNDDDPTASDQREGLRRMIDAARTADPLTATDVLFPGAA